MNFFNWLKRLFKKKEEVGKTIYHFCNICYVIPSINKEFHCSYCKKWHCEKHRLPEKHDCKNPINPHQQPTAESLGYT